MAPTRRTDPQEESILMKYYDMFVKMKNHSSEKLALVEKISKEIKSMTPLQVRTWMTNRAFRESKSSDVQMSCRKQVNLPDSFNGMVENPPLKEITTSSALQDICRSETQIYYNQCLYQKITPKKPKKNLLTVYYKCKNCGTKLKVKMLFTGEVEIEFGKKILHNESCYNNLGANTKANIRWNEIKARAIELYRSADGKRSTAAIAAAVAREALEFQRNHPNDIQLLITEKLIRNWISEIKPVTPKSMFINPIPSEIMKPDGVNEWIRLVINYPSPIILFFTNDALSLASHTPRLLIDGTYKTRPLEFAQVLNGSGFNTSTKKYFPIFHILMKGHDISSYNRALNEVIQFLNFDQINKVIYDFDQALITAITTVFSANYADIKFQGCYFHFVKSLKDKLESIFGKDSQASVKYLMILREAPFLSYQNLEILISYLRNDDSLFSFLSYWDKTWGPFGIFPPEIWSTFKKPNNNYVTNDGIERYHEEMHADLGVHPSFGEFSKKLYYLDIRCQTTSTANDQVPHVDYAHSEKDSIDRLNQLIDITGFKVSASKKKFGVRVPIIRTCFKAKPKPKKKKIIKSKKTSTTSPKLKKPKHNYEE